MSKILLTVALLFISGLATNAAADEALKEPSTKARKLNAYLEAIGLNDPRIIKFTTEFDQRREGKFLRLTEENFEAGRVVLHYEMRPKIGTRQLQLKFQPDKSRSEFTATTRSVMYNYKLKF